MSQITKTVLVLSCLGFVFNFSGCAQRKVDAQPEHTTWKAENNLQEVVAKFNDELEQEQPWGFYKVTDEMVKVSVEEQMESISPAYQAAYQRVLDGKVPTEMDLMYSASEKDQYFVVRLNFWPTDIRFGTGYGLRIGEDVGL